MNYYLNKLMTYHQEYQMERVFAYDHNIFRARVGRSENGQDLKFSNLLKIVAAFDITLEEFFSEGYYLTGIELLRKFRN